MRISDWSSDVCSSDLGIVQRELAKRLIDQAPDDALVNVRESTRTDEQNAKMWAMLSDIARAKPMGRVHKTDDWKSLFMDMCGFPAKWVPSLDGEGVVNQIGRAHV